MFSTLSFVTLAHELGHGFHEMQIKNNGALNRNYSMPVAETASNFNENLLVSYAIDHAESDDEKLMLIENRLQNARFFENKLSDFQHSFFNPVAFFENVC